MAATIVAERGLATDRGIRSADINPAAPPPSVWIGADGSRIPSKITIKNLDFFYGRTKALSGVSLEIPYSRVTGIIGPSGCGKSTLLRVLNRIYERCRGQRATGVVQLEGQDILGRNVNLEVLRSRVGMVFRRRRCFRCPSTTMLLSGRGCRKPCRAPTSTSVWRSC